LPFDLALKRMIVEPLIVFLGVLIKDCHHNVWSELIGLALEIALKVPADSHFA